MVSHKPEPTPEEMHERIQEMLAELLPLALEVRDEAIKHIKPRQAESDTSLLVEPADERVSLASGRALRHPFERGDDT